MTTREMQADSSGTPSEPPPQPLRDCTKFNTKAIVAKGEVRFEYRPIGKLPDVFLRAFGDNALHALKNLKRCVKARCEELGI